MMAMATAIPATPDASGDGASGSAGPSPEQPHPLLTASSVPPLPRMVFSAPGDGGMLVTKSVSLLSESAPSGDRPSDKFSEGMIATDATPSSSSNSTSSTGSMGSPYKTVSCTSPMQSISRTPSGFLDPFPNENLLSSSV